MSESLVEFNKISKFFGSVIALKDVTMHIKKLGKNILKFLSLFS